MGSFETDAARYDRDLEQGLKLSGETKDFFAQGRILRTAQSLISTGSRPRRIMDYGCGPGDSLPLLKQAFPEALIVGADLSRSLIEEARAKNPDWNFRTLDEASQEPPFDLVYCNGVFHHIPPAERDDCFRRIRDLLQPGGWLALFENNPLNPATRLVMRRIPFDRDAITLFHWETRSRISRAGLDVVRTEFLFFFPRLLSRFRWLEPSLRHCLLGAQYLVLARRKP